MKATDQDIAFARTVAATARRGETHCGEGLYFDCVRAEYGLVAVAYEDAAKRMTETGEFSLPSDADLKALAKRAWAPIEA